MGCKFYYVFAGLDAKHLNDVAAANRKKFLNDEARAILNKECGDRRIFLQKRSSGSSILVLPTPEIVKNVEDEDICALAAFMLQTAISEPATWDKRNIVCVCNSTREARRMQIVLA